MDQRPPATPRVPKATDVLKEVAAGGKSNPPSNPQGSVKETIESILIAFIFAFMFRAFVVEAFVIPTGSMAPTLLGAHMRFDCPDCGHEFKVNYSAQGEGDQLVIPSHFPGVLNRDRKRVLQEWVCENCGYVIKERPGDPPKIHYGDRILVLKYLYLFEDPQRWDVVVFKSPDNPGTYDYSQNYIKRLIGKPGETIMILDGDIYVGNTQQQPQDPNEYASFAVQTKPRYVQDSLWRIVYDNDHYPRRNIGWKQPWTPRAADSGWDLGNDPLTGRVFEFNKPQGAGAIYFDPSANPTKKSLTDWLGYDQGPRDPAWEVADLKLDLFYQRIAGDGPLRLKLTKFGDTIIAEITPTSARVLLQKSNGETIVIGESTNVASATTTAPIHIELMNVDYQVTLRIDGTDVIRSTPQQYAPDIASLLSMHASQSFPKKAGAEIEAESQQANVSHVRLWRDIYYLTHHYREGNRGIHLVRSATPENVMRLGADEFFVLGDNSFISGDSRYWGDPINLPDEELSVDAGKVPARFMLGKAFFVYWPAGFTPLTGLPALVPNFGEMRFIH